MSLSTNQTPQKPLVGIDPKTGQVINNALCTLYVWTGLGQPCQFVDPNQLPPVNPDGTYDTGGLPPRPPQKSNTLLYVLLGAGGAALITYLIIKKNK
jgi:hypothetical protein